MQKIIGWWLKKLIIVVIGVMILAIIALAIMFWYITLPIIGLLIFFWKYPDWAEKRRREKEAKITRQYYADQEQKKRDEEQWQRERSLWLEEQRRKDSEIKQKQSWTIFRTKNDHPSSTKEKNVIKQKAIGFASIPRKRKNGDIYDQFESRFEEMKYELENLDQLTIGRCYTIFGLEHDASVQQIKERFRILALEYHPDRNKDAQEKFSLIYHVYRMILQEKMIIV